MIIDFQKKYCLTNREAALLCGCSLATVQKWRGGSVPLPDVVHRFLALLDVACHGDGTGLRCFAEQSAEALETGGVSAELVQEFAEQMIEAASEFIQTGCSLRKPDESIRRYKAKEAAAREARKEAEKMNRLRDSRLVEMSYQLRTPMNSILGAGQLLRHELLGSPQETLAETLLSSGSEMMRLIDSMEEFPADRTPTTDQTTRPDEIRALIVEDNPASLTVFNAMLLRLGCTTEHALNGLEAVQAAGRQAFDLIFMDIEMPVMNGVDAVRKIRRQEKKESRSPVFICAVTAYAMPGDREKYLAAGMDAYLAKPISLEALSSVVKKRSPATGSVS